MNQDYSHLIPLGWNDHFNKQLNEIDNKFFTTDYQIARVSSVEHGLITLFDGVTQKFARLSGKLIRETQASQRDKTAVGDWVIYRKAQDNRVIEVILPAFNALYRVSAGATSDRQIISANIDTIFIVTGLDHDFNLRRLERYLTISYESGAKPVVLLNKCDLCHPDDMITTISQVEELAPGVPVHMVSSLYHLGIDELKPYLQSPFTITVVGSSGCGKSSLINILLGETFQKTSAVRVNDSRGRHTTVTRSLFVLPEGGVIIDNPGMREVQLYATEESVDKTFTEISELVNECKFSNCTHGNEPGCAVQKALKEGIITSERWTSYQKQKSETGYNKKRQIEQKKAREKEISKFQKSFRKQKYKY
jgi:ribosome biogenesis GTPase / thiamine phosphate phosphatase